MSNFSEELRAALLKCMKPLARILLRAGVGYTEFEAITKTAFVEVASTEFGVRGRPTNTSRIAAMTGLTRKEIAKIRTDHGQSLPGKTNVTPASDILHFWHFDTDFLDSEGAPLPLAISGDAPSFTGLTNKYGGDIPAGALRKELERVGAIREDRFGRLMPTKRHFTPPGLDQQFVRVFDRPLFFLLSSLERNLDPSNIEQFAERIVFSTRIPSGAIPHVRAGLRTSVAEFTESVDEWIAEREVELIADDAKGVGLGVYYFET